MEAECINRALIVQMIITQSVYYLYYASKMCISGRVKVALVCHNGNLFAKMAGPKHM